MYPDKIELENHGIKYTVKVSHWQKHGKNRLYINELGLCYDLDASEFTGNLTPQKGAIAKQVKQALGL